MRDKKVQENGVISRGYLVLYNFLQTVGWTYIAVTSCQHFAAQNALTSQGLYSKIEVPLKIFQTAAALEVIHCLIGIVPSSALFTTLQVFSRLCIVWLTTDPVKEVQDNTSILMYITAWTITEIIRYAFYTCSLLNCKAYILRWCRYTFFIVLYPVGVTGEYLSVLAAIPYIKERGIYSLSLPNSLNISFSLLNFMYFSLVMYFPGFYTVFTHMLRQRKKVLGKSHQESSKVD